MLFCTSIRQLLNTSSSLYFCHDFRKTLCLPQENFMFATVSERDPRYLQRGYVCIEFVCNNGIVGADVRQNLRDLINQGRRELLEDSDDEELLEEEEDPQAQENIQGGHIGAYTLFNCKSNLISGDNEVSSYQKILIFQ